MRALLVVLALAALWSLYLCHPHAGPALEGCVFLGAAKKDVHQGLLARGYHLKMRCGSSWEEWSNQTLELRVVYSSGGVRFAAGQVAFVSLPKAPALTSFDSIYLQDRLGEPDWGPGCHCEQPLRYPRLGITFEPNDVGDGTLVTLGQ